MASTSFSMHNILARETERTRGSSSIQIKQLIAESDSKIASIQNEIAVLESQIAALVERREQECAAGDALRYLAAPIRTLPIELLTEIFVLASTAFKHIRDAFRVSQVCRHWRQVASCTPRLWTGPIEVDFYRKREPDEEEVYTNGLKWRMFSRSNHHQVGLTVPPPCDVALDCSLRAQDDLLSHHKHLESLLDSALATLVLLHDSETAAGTTLPYSPHLLAVVRHLASRIAPGVPAHEYDLRPCHDRST
ncbi:F-box domain-containing protein [Mycena sanguinolenta]|uniref:F-box domain-containing protein n=1 Tax=Mycena sanguinolenta TaxID=230812 RepID=A0A8H6YG94_9AGAR|nr:F-box domain-containing protein [Mycena sanguinolenta]